MVREFAESAVGYFNQMIPGDDPQKRASNNLTSLEFFWLLGNLLPL
jgi:hypothetical protein